MDEELVDTWQKRWDGEKPYVSFLGKMMFKAKAEGIREVVRKFHPKEVFEVGAGLGYTLEVFAEMNVEAKGIDVSENAVTACIKRGLKVECRKVEDETQMHELVASDGMLEHFLHFEPYAVDLMKISKRYILLIQPDHGSFLGKTLVYLSELIRGDSNVFEYNYRIKDFVDVFAKHGFGLKFQKGIFGNVFCLLLFERYGEDH